jgi:hypothetical protein
VELLDRYLPITKAIQELGHEIPEDWLSRVKRLESVRNNEPLNFEGIERLRREGLRAIETTDLLIAEVSLSSVGVGYQIAKALELKKPVLCLYTPELTQEMPSQIIMSESSALLTVKKYNLDNIKKVLSGYFKNFRKGNLLKFNFIISPEIMRYLDWKSRNGKLSKSEILRELVTEKVISSDEEYTHWLSKIQ